MMSPRRVRGLIVALLLLAPFCVGQVAGVATAGAASPKLATGGDFFLLVRSDGALHAFNVNAAADPTITATAGPNGSITPSGPVSVLDGDSQSFTIAADPHYQIDDVKVDGGSVGAVSSYDFTNVTSDHTIDATFAAITHTITATAGPNGSITPSGSVSVTDGDSQGFTIAAGSHYQIADVKVDGGSVGAVGSYTFPSVTSDHTIAATFAAITHTITATAGPNGSITPSGSVSVTDGANQSFTIAASSHYQIADVKVDGGSVGAVSSYTFPGVTSDHSIAATFAAVTHTISATAGAHGSISPSGPVSVVDGANQSFTIAADAFYQIADVKVDGVSNPAAVAAGAYTFTGVTTDHSIAASFSKKDTTPPTTTATRDGTAGDNGWYTSAVTVTFKATDNAGGSGMSGGQAGTSYSLDGGATWTEGTSFSKSAEGTYTALYHSTDAAGNVEADNSVTVKIDATPPVTTDNAPTGWSKDAVTVTFTADAGGVSPIASTQYRIGTGSWTQGTQVTFTKSGNRVITYRSTDNAGNVEANKTCRVKTDMAKPVTSDNAPSGWRKAPVTVTLTATDLWSGLTGGNARTEYSLLGGMWITGTSVLVPADAVTHADDGAHVITYRSVDAVGNVEAPKTCTVRIDTQRPTPSAPRAAGVRRGNWVSLAYKVSDPRPGSATAKVTIKIKTRGGRTVKQVTLRARKVNATLAYKFRCTLSRGKYRFYVNAVDQARNAALQAASNKLRVR